MLQRNEYQSPYLDAKINGVDMVVFLDTGAEMSIINENFYRSVMGEKAEFYKSQLQARTFSTARFQCKKKARFDLQLGNEIFNVCAYAYLGKMSDCFDLLIGMDLIALLDLEYSTPNQIVFSKKYNVCLPIRGPKQLKIKKRISL